MVMCGFRWGWLGSVSMVVGGISLSDRWIGGGWVRLWVLMDGSRWVDFGGLACEF